MFDVGDVVEVFAPTAGKKKYHLCVCCANDAGVTQFFFLLTLAMGTRPTSYLQMVRLKACQNPQRERV